MKTTYEKFASVYPQSIRTNIDTKEKFIIIIDNDKNNGCYIKDHYQDGSMSSPYSDYALRGKNDGYFLLCEDNTLIPITF